MLLKKTNFLLILIAHDEYDMTFTKEITTKKTATNTAF